MAIIGKTDNSVRQAGAGLPLIGRVYKGAARSDEDIQRNRPGKELAHFRIELEERYRTSEHLAALDALYGKDPIAFPHVFFAGETVDQVFPTWMEEWGKTGIIHRCDGQQQTLWLNPETGRTDSKPVACGFPGNGCKCKPVGRLKLLFPDFIKATNIFGYFALNTHSEFDVRALTQSLHDAWLISGSLRGVEFVLSRYEEEIAYPEIDKATKKPTGKRLTKKHWLLRLETSQEANARVLLPAAFNAPVAALPSGERPPYVDEDGAIAEDAPGADAEIVWNWSDTAVLNAIRPMIEGNAGISHSLIGDLIEANILAPHMTDEEAIAVAKAYCSKTATAHNDESAWVNDAGMGNAFLQEAQDKFSHDPDEVCYALHMFADYPINRVADWRGDKGTAWAVLIASAGDFKDIRAGLKPAMRAAVTYINAEIARREHAPF